MKIRSRNVGIGKRHLSIQYFYMKHYFFIILIVLTFLNLNAQVKQDSTSRDTLRNPDYSLTMDEAVQYALDNNYEIINARRDILSALKKKWETTAQGLPHISAGVDYMNSLKLQVQLVPAEFFGGIAGEFIPITFGTQQQLSASATATQLLFSGSYIVAIQASKTFLEFTGNMTEKTILETRKAVINAYGNVLLARAGVDILKKNVAILKRNVFESKKLYENGFTELESVEQLRITLSQVENSLRNAERMGNISIQLLKVALGIPIEKTLVLEDNLESLARENIEVTLLNEHLDIEENINYQIASTLTEQRELELKLEKSKSLPTLSTFINYGVRANSNEFSFLDSDQKWYNSSVWGIKMDIPIFSSFQRRARKQQAMIALDKARTSLTQTSERIRLQVIMLRSDYRYAIATYHTAQENLELAQRIADKNQTKFGSGLASSFELHQAQTQLYAAQNELLQAMLKIITTKTALETVLNTPQIEVNVEK